MPKRFTPEEAVLAEKLGLLPGNQYNLTLPNTDANWELVSAMEAWGKVGGLPRPLLDQDLVVGDRLVMGYLAYRMAQTLEKE